MKEETNNPIIFKNGNYYNTITKRYVSESYAKRINNYFKKNPNGTLARATGHYSYSRTKSITNLSIETRKKIFGTGEQFVQTYDKKGKPVYYSISQKENIDLEEIKKIRKLDYHICNDKAFVELYRMTRDRNNIYHLVTWKINKNIKNPYQIDMLKPELIGTYKCIEKEVKKILPKGKNVSGMYFHISCYFYSKIDGWRKGTISQVYVARKDQLKYLYDEFINKLDWYQSRLESNAYYNIYIERFTFYVTQYVGDVTEYVKTLSKYRLGVNRGIEDIKEIK